MKLAVISPIRMLREIQTTHDLRYHLVLTQYWSSPEYRSFYKERQAAGDFIILDNGAAEKKISISADDVMEVARDLRPSVVVAPDVIYDKGTTIERTTDFAFMHRRELRSLGTDIMAVPQGQDSLEWFECFNHFNSRDWIDWLGISMFYSPIFMKRHLLLDSIANTVTKPCHLLGLWQNPYELETDKKFDFVRGVDSAKPVEFAIEGLGLHGWAAHKHMDDDWYIREAGADGVIGKLVHENIVEMKRIVS